MASIRRCSVCSATERLYLHDSRIYCRDCLPVDTLPYTERIGWALRSQEERCRELRATRCQIHEQREQIRAAVLKIKERRQQEHR